MPRKRPLQRVTYVVDENRVYVRVTDLISALEAWGQVSENREMAAGCMSLAEMLQKELEEIKKKEGLE